MMIGAQVKRHGRVVAFEEQEPRRFRLPLILHALTHDLGKLANPR